ncbi:Gldg family protein [Pseudomonadales bacterium]|nr:Gldg family protein [Pseudomonadales bacterium]MDB4150649.1 Gldg family protein [Pseudomonadales bacterium]MDB9866982.1 Gldg family protein [Pseudomonadales bacterium]MDB9917056.1 Gldg family protein [Pseudomonadales bacterium]MDB9942650.1 Gldg family protein [Pseudomonadales bacterium]
MNRNLISGLGLFLLALAFVMVILLNNLWFSGIRVDLTENKLFTLAAGTREIVQDIDEPINLYFFFSEKASEDLTTLRAYANRVRELLQEYALLADGKINLQLIDPEPFSDAEDRAAAFGLQGVPVNSAGDELYFGLAATNALDDQQVIGFFQPDKEEFLEYEISKLIQNLLVQNKPKVGLLSSLKVQGDMDMNTFQTTPAWVVIDQIDQASELQTITPDAESLPAGLDLLVLIQPHGLAESLLSSIDQFALSGGRVLVFVDPLAEMDQSQVNPVMGMSGAETSIDFPLLAGWGVLLRKDVVLGDAQQALTVSGADGQPVRHLSILGLQAQNFNNEDVILSSLETINVSTAGILDVLDQRSTQVDVLMASSEYAMPIERLRLKMLGDPSELLPDFQATGLVYPVAVRITGAAKSQYPVTVDGDDSVLSTGQLNVIVVADTDILTDRLWVQLQDFFGQRIVSPWANNGDFVTNAVDNLTGSSALISIRSRGRFSRPFEVVQDLRREAEASYLNSANDLQAQLAETERQLGELESSRDEQNLMSLSPEQEAALVRFQQEKLRIRKALRNVRHQLDKDIEMLGSTLKFMNIVLMPLVLTFILLVLKYLRLHQISGRRQS